MNRLRHYWYKLRSSFWFLPALIVMGCVALAGLLIEADGMISEQTLARWPRVFGVGASGARGLLTAIASSMITVAGVVFSITLVALSLASSQYTPRVLHGFMRDRMNQTVLGIFVGIFGYCLIVLRTIRAGDGEDSFVPPLAVLVGLILGFVGIGFLIYFIHHIAISIQASAILAAVYHETSAIIDSYYPDRFNPACDERVIQPQAREGHHWRQAPAGRTGYVQQIDTDALLEIARKHKTAIRIERSVGAFVVQGNPLVSIYTPNAAEEPDLNTLADAVLIGSDRSLEQDVAFGIRQLVDVALKALSAGINDTTTACTSVDYLCAVLVRLSGRQIESCRSDDGQPRLLTGSPTFRGFVDAAFNEVRQNAGGNCGVLDRMIGSLRTLGESNADPGRRAELLRHAIAVEESIHRTVPAPPDRARLEARVSSVIAVLREGAGPMEEP